MTGDFLLPGGKSSGASPTSRASCPCQGIVRINAAARQFGLSYSRFMDGLNKAGIEIDRKVLADLAVHDIAAFGVLAEKAKASLG